MSSHLRVLHVCTANICRSPIAERLMRHGLEQRLGPAADAVLVESAGTAGFVGSRMAPESETALQGHGVDGGDFRARELVTELVVEADLVLTATRQHRAAAVRHHPRAAAKSFTLREFARLSAGVDGAALPPPDRLVERGRALVRAVGAQRGRVPLLAPEDDDIADPYRGPSAGFVSCAQLVSDALQRPLDLLAGRSVGAVP